VSKTGRYGCAPSEMLVFGIINDMNRNNQRKIQPTIRIIEHDKENNSDLESLLVSSVRYDTVLNSQAESHLDAPHTPPSVPPSVSPSIMGSLIRKNKCSNVYVEESYPCHCHEQIQTLCDSIQLLGLQIK